jgi:voltage-gated sodium channel
MNIIGVGAVTGIDLEMSDHRAHGYDLMSLYVSRITLVVFFCEVILKLLAEGFEPWMYFLDRNDGYFNTFDFVVVACSIAFLGDSNGQTISFLRMLRLLRLLTFVKGVPQLRIIVAGLIQGVKSVIYIVLLLFLVIYMYAILGCILFGENDPVHFGTVAISMLSLFQVRKK